MLSYLCSFSIDFNGIGVPLLGWTYVVVCMIQYVGWSEGMGYPTELIGMVMVSD